MNIFRLFVFSSICLVCFSCSADLGGRIDQHPEVPIPEKVTIRNVTPISGGAIIHVSIPDDFNLKGVVAIYKRNGEEINTKISKYVDSLVVEGFPNTEPQTVKICSFNVNGVLSEPQEVTFVPLKPAIMTVVPTLIDSYGGVKVDIQGNDSRSDLAVCLLRDTDVTDISKPLNQRKWVEVTTMFTSSNDIRLTRRGLPPVTAMYGVYIRDHWGNISDTTVAVLTPLWEAKLDTVRYTIGPNKGKLAYVFSDAKIPDDNCVSQNSGYYPVSALWDNVISSDAPYIFVSSVTGPSPTWLTIDLGRKASLSRVFTYPRIGYNPYKDGAVRDYEFWGSPGELMSDGSYGKPSGKTVTPTVDNPYGFDPDVWFCLGKFTQPKPSGYLSNGLVGTITPEDTEAFNSGNDFEFDKYVYPHCNDEVRYLRVVFVNTFATFEFGHNSTNRQVQTGDVYPYGQPILED